MKNRNVLGNLKAHPDETGLFFDLDGTLAELVDVPEAVRLPAQTRAHLRSLSDRYRSVVVISGRAAPAVRAIVGLPHLTYVGNHGLEIIESGEHRIWLPESDVVRMRAMEEVLRSVQLEGVVLELKELSHAFHYRGAPDPTMARARILATLDGLALEGVRIREGKFLVQIRPDVPLDKGTAVERLVRERGITKVLYAGDDTTDIDAFRVIGTLEHAGVIEGYRVAVVTPDAPEALLSTSDLRADGVQDIQDLLSWLAE